MNATKYNKSRHDAGRIYPLKFLGYLPSKIAACEPGSDNEMLAIKEWQLNMGLTVDGCIGPKTADLMHLKAIQVNVNAVIDEYLTPNFDKSDFKCKDGSSVPDEYMANARESARNLEVIRSVACSNNPITIISGYRSFKYNVSIDGAHDSKHLIGIATDIRCPGLNVTVSKLRGLIESVMLNKHIPMGGCQYYNGDKFVHVDHRGGNKPTHWKTS